MAVGPVAGLIVDEIDLLGDADPADIQCLLTGGIEPGGLTEAD
jgi:hypothetical protein